MNKKITKILTALTLGLTLFGLSACSTNGPKADKPAAKVVQTPIEDTQFLMGTVVQIKIYNENKKMALKDAFDRVKVLADKITVNQKGSEVDAVNNQAGVKPVKVSADILRLIKGAIYFSKNSEDSFDLAIGPITSLWHIGFDDARKPSQAEIDRELKFVNYKNVVLDEKKRTVFLKQKGMKLDLGGIAKGYIADEVVKVLKKDGVNTAIVDLGGNIFVMGTSPTGKNKPWTVGIQDPESPRGTSLGKLPASNQTIVTSGIYERYLKVGNKTYMHLMNPKTGYPFDNNLMGVSIITKKSINGDGLSTATFDKGLKEGLKYIESKKDTEAIFVTKDHKVYITSGLKGKFELLPDVKYTLVK